MYLKEHTDIAELLEQKIRVELLVKKEPVIAAALDVELIDD